MLCWQAPKPEPRRSRLTNNVRFLENLPPKVPGFAVWLPFSALKAQTEKVIWLR